MRRRSGRSGRSGRPGRSGRSRGRPGGPGRSGGSSITLTGRGGIVLILGAGLLAEFFGNVLHLGFLSGLGFVAACGLAAVATRAGDLLTLVVSPPLIFLVITMVGEFVGALGERSLSRSMFVGVMTTFAASAPWLFFGTALAIVIALPRGLPAAVRALRSVPSTPPGTPDDSDDSDDPDVSGDGIGPVRGAAAGARGRGADHADDDPVRWDN